MANEIVFSDSEGQVITGRRASGTAAKDEGHFSVGVPFFGSGSEELRRPGIDSWDSVFLAGIQVPGLARVQGALKRKTDKKRSSGVNGARVTHLGFDAAEFTVTVQLWHSSHLPAYEKIVALFKPKKGTAPKAVDCYHPALEVMGITSVEILEMGLLRRTAPGVYEADIKCIEFVPAKKVGVSTQKSAQPSLGTFETAIPRPPAPSTDSATIGPITDFVIAQAGG